MLARMWNKGALIISPLNKTKDKPLDECSMLGTNFQITGMVGSSLIHFFAETLTVSIKSNKGHSF